MVDALPEIEGFHAHLYFRDAGERALAMRLRQRIGQRFPAALIGRVHDKAVGPHPRPMYQVAFDPEAFGDIVPWLMLVHGSLSVLVHPLAGDPLPEHRDHAIWIGEPLPLRLAIFEAMRR